MYKNFLYAIALFLPLALAAQQLPATAAKPAPPQASNSAMSAPSGTAAQPATNNTALTGAIMQRLIADPILQNTAITVAVTGNGAVTLNGVVARQEVLDRAIAVVKSVPGVKSVTSQILVNTDPFAPPKPPLPSPLPPINAAPPPLPASSSPQVKLADALGAAPGLIRVDSRVYDDQVLLFGTVETEQAKKDAEAIARKTLPKLPISNIIWVDQHPLSPPPLTPQ